MLVGAMAIIGLIDNFIRFIAQEGGVWQFYLFRAILTCSIISVYLMVKNRSLRPRNWRWVVIRSLLTAAAILIYFIAISVMPIAEAGATLFSSPIFLLIFSVLLFRISVGYWRASAVFIGFIGVLLVLKPNPYNLNIFVLLPATAGAMYALGQLVTRHKCSDEDVLVLLLGFFLGTGLLGAVGLTVVSVIEFPPHWLAAAPFATTGWVFPTGKFLFWTMIQGLGSLVGVAGLIRGYQIAEPTYVTVFEYSFVIFAGFWGWVIWHEVPDSISLIGIVLVISAGVVITLRSVKSRKS